MKIKLDYVTNSSSTSFCIYGTTLQLRGFCEVLGVKGCEPGWTPEIDYEDVYELLESIEGLEFQYMDGDWLVGMSPDAMGEDETRRQFKARISEMLRTKLLVDVKPEDMGLEYGEVYDG